ncbi:vWA domain-containing protein [Gilliamella sp. G0441]|uniref:vWA domain-containing protein n=1 Tax=Gilliamella sp. G0441 TaxID=3384760 RepID=UPI003D34771A
MKLIKTVLLAGLSILSLCSHAQVNKQIEIRSELASPIVMQNTQEKNYLKISLTGHEFDSAKRVPINLAIVIDRSGSMSGDRIVKAKEAAIFAINMLNENDTLSVVAYDNDAKVIIPSTKVNNKQKLINLIKENIVAGGGTALFAGLSKGIYQVEKQLSKDNVNRIILLSDGQANIGPTSVQELSELAIIAAKKNISVSTFGIGEDYNELLMSSIASYSDGNHVFVNDSLDLENVFVREFKDVMSTVAQHVKINIYLKDGVKPVRLLGRDGIIKGNQVTVTMNQIYSNQEKYILLEVEQPQGKVGEEKTLAEIDLVYDDLLDKKTQKERQSVKLAYTDNLEAVKKALRQDVVTEIEIQEVNENSVKALEFYNKGDRKAAQKILEDNSKRLEAVANMYPEYADRVLDDIKWNEKMAADAVNERGNSKAYRKGMTEKQQNTKLGVIKK